jgi:hypothetical protein
MRWLVIVGAVVAGLWLIDRLLLWCELRGWICYRLSPRQMRSLGRAGFSVEALLQPEKKHVYEMSRAADQYREEDDDGGRPPAP